MTATIGKEYQQRENRNYLFIYLFLLLQLIEKFLFCVLS